MSLEVESLEGMDFELESLGFNYDELLILEMDATTQISVDAGESQTIVAMEEHGEPPEPSQPENYGNGGEYTLEGVTFTVRLSVDDNETLMSAIRHLKAIGKAKDMPSALIYMAENHG